MYLNFIHIVGSLITFVIVIGESLQFNWCYFTCLYSWYGWLQIRVFFERFPAGCFPPSSLSLPVIVLLMFLELTIDQFFLLSNSLKIKSSFDRKWKLWKGLSLSQSISLVCLWEEPARRGRAEALSPWAWSPGTQPMWSEIAYLLISKRTFVDTKMANYDLGLDGRLGNFNSNYLLRCSTQRDLLQLFAPFHLTTCIMINSQNFHEFKFRAICHQYRQNWVRYPSIALFD